jgi:hypothetical protein
LPGSGVGKQPGFSADDEGFYSALGAVIIDFQSAIVEVADKLRPLVLGVADGFADQAFFGNGVFGFLQPVPQLMKCNRSLCSVLTCQFNVTTKHF